MEEQFQVVMDKVVYRINYYIDRKFASMMMRMFILQIATIIVLLNGNEMQTLEKVLLVEMDVGKKLIN